MASAGCCRKRSSRRSIFWRSRLLSESSGTSIHTSFSSRPMRGIRATTVARRNRVFARAMDTVVMVVSMKSKCTTALTA